MTGKPIRGIGRFGRPLAVLLIGTLTAGASAQTVTSQQVEQTKARIREFIYSQQDAKGSWEKAYNHGHAASGATAIAAYALLMSGESPQDPRLQKAIQYLRMANLIAAGQDYKGIPAPKPESEKEGVYSTGLRLHVWGHLPDEMLGGLGLPLMESDAQALASAANKDNKFGYDIPAPGKKPGGGYDHSNSQYGLLGLWEAAKRGVKITGNFWEVIVDSWVREQNPDGGWEYKDAGGKSNNNMTSAGLTALYVAQQELHRNRSKPDPRLQSAIDKGLEWLDKNYSPGGSGLSRPGYSYYGVERVGMASGIRFFKNRDWFVDGATSIVKAAQGSGQWGDFPSTCFGLMFLSRGHVPVWINKLMIPGASWNNRPNDLYFLSQYLSDLREDEVNWQVVPINTTVDRWLSAPLLYLASDEALKLSDEQKAAIKRYLDLGGTLWCNPDAGSQPFIASVEALAKELFPRYPMRNLPADHPFYNALVQVPPAAGQNIRGVSNGARELIILPTRDWGMDFQREEDPRRSVAWKIASNIFLIFTDRGVLPDRLDDTFVNRDKSRSASGSLMVARPRYEGAWLPEPGGWVQLSNHLYNRTGLELAFTPASDKQDAPAEERPLDLDKLADSNAPLVHLAGTAAYTLTDAQIQAIKAYTERGGTVLVETVGGQGDFAKNIEAQLQQALGSAPFPLAADQPIISGQGLTGGTDCRRIDYRRYTVITLSLGRRPLLAAFFVNDRPAIILTREDLTLGAMGVRNWGVIGYEARSATNLLSNIVLYAQQSASRMKPADSAPAAAPAPTP